MIEAYKPLFAKYNTILKPLLAEQEVRSDRFEEASLSLIFNFLNSIAEAEDCKTPVRKASKLKESDTILDDAISVSYQYIISAIAAKMRLFEKSNEKILEHVHDGKFIGKYQGKKRQAVLLVDESQENRNA